MCISLSLISIVHSRFIAIYSDLKSRQRMVTRQSFSRLDDIIIISVSIHGKAKAYLRHLLVPAVSTILRFFSHHVLSWRKYCSDSLMQIILLMVRVITECLKHSISVIQIVLVLSSIVIGREKHGKFPMMAKSRW